MDIERLGSAARMLSCASQIAEVDQEVLELQRLHAVGKPRPSGDLVGQDVRRMTTRCALPSQRQRPDTALGISGGIFICFGLHRHHPPSSPSSPSSPHSPRSPLVFPLSAKSTPGSAMLFASRLTPLATANGGSIRSPLVSCPTDWP